MINKPMSMLFSFLGLPGLVFAFNNYQPQTEMIGFYATTPPAFFYVSNPHGQRAGADPTITFSPVGQQGDGLHGLEEIPGAVTDQENIQDGSTGLPNKHTHWSVRIPDGGLQTYTVNVIGITTGQGFLEVSSERVKSSQKGQTSVMNYLITAGSTKQFTVNYNPAASSISIVSNVGNGDLLNDVKSACALNLITSRRVCKRLEKKAEAIQDALAHHRNKEARELVKSFLHSLGEDRGDGDNDRDDHDAIKEPALSILIADAKALLQTLPDDDHHDH